MFLNVGAPSPVPGVARPETRLAALLDALPAPTAILDGNGRISACNAAWRALGEGTATFGDLGTLVTQADHVGSAYVNRLAALEGPLATAAHRLARDIQEVLAGRAPQALVEYRRRRPEADAAFEARVAPLPSATGTEALVQHVDVADRERVADAHEAALRLGLQAEIERAKHRALLRRLADLGRDLHAPVTPVRLELHLLAQQALGPLTPAQQRALDLVARNVQRWAEDEQALLESPGQPEPAGARLDLARLAFDAAERATPRALTQGVRLVRPHPAAALPVQASAGLVADAVDLLVGRAIAASPAGTTVAIEVGARDGEAVLEVRDCGPGASPRELRGCFEAWGGRPPSAEADGAFELPYVKWAIESMGGHVFAESDGPGLGLLIGLALPLAAAGGAAG